MADRTIIFVSEERTVTSYSTCFNLPDLFTMRLRLSRILFFILLVLLLLLNAKRYLYRFLKPFDYSYYAGQYLHSQYVEGEGSKYIVSDYDLYSFAGHYYFTGGEVSRVNFENPPLGKYLLGLSIYLFNNQVVIYLIYAVAYLFITYKFGMLIFRRREIALFALIFLVIDPYFLHGISMPLLDFPMASFFLIGFYLFFTAKTWKKYIFSTVFFGLSIATKFFPFFAILLLFMAIYQWKYRRRDLRIFILCIPIILLVYTASFFEYFIHQHKNIVDFIYYQWWMLRWRMGNPIVTGNILQGIMFGRASRWWMQSGGYMYWTEEWSFMMPFVTMGAVMSFWVIRKYHYYIIFYLYCALFLTYAIFVTEGGLKYLMPIYPFFVIFTSAAIFRIGILVGKNFHRLQQNRLIYR